ncbi:MAG: RRXRR domain-containing protein [Proteobacteria bacterium]|nr:RRXRR domain-containing protein [Pseudomonadota bacterium]MBU1742885.1 RRXRR domain-containing protein [Pseudomonadota bacterium]
MGRVTLAIDFGSTHIGLALVRNQNGQNEPLFAGTISYKQKVLKDKSVDRAQLRRLRRTRKTKHTRLRRLEAGLRSCGLNEAAIGPLVGFCRRRGYKNLFKEYEEEERRGKQQDETIDSREFGYREDFFKALEVKLDQLVPEDKRASARAVCERVLNLAGDRRREIRPLRFDNRGKSWCAWEGCDRVPPRRKNAPRDALAQFVYTVIDLDYVKEAPESEAKLEDMLDAVAVLGKRHRNANGKDKQVVDHERKVLKARITKEIKQIRELLKDEPDEDREKKRWSTVKGNIENLLLKSRGRNRYCRQHSAEHVQHLREGQPVPFKASLTERDLVSRREEMLYQKLWRYIEARLLPLAPEGIDRLVVERVAFDLLAGTFKQRQRVGDQTLEAMYQQGPRYRPFPQRPFKNDLEMLRIEFEGRCAYCGQESAELTEVDHILPRSEFFFDSYLNIVPACPTCNREAKGKASPTASGMSIAPEAYDAYSRYVKSKRPPHLLHAEKKGILKLMKRDDEGKARTWEAEKHLTFLANKFAVKTQTQRSPRPMARFLAERIGRPLGQAPKVRFHNGRHTAIWRKAAYPGFDKYREKEEGGVINHALDALILACDLPDITRLEHMGLTVSDIDSWIEAVRDRPPEADQDGLPLVPKPKFAVDGFEEVLPGNFVHVDLGCFNWNRKNTAVQRQGIYGWSKRQDDPTIRKPAADWSNELKAAKKPEKVEAIIKSVAHPNLRRTLEEAHARDKTGEAVAKALIEWLRKAIKPTLADDGFSSHPANQRIKRGLIKFVESQDENIPVFIGVKRFSPDHKEQKYLSRADKTGRIIHRYMADPAYRAIIVGYEAGNGKVQRDTPLTCIVRQNGEVVPRLKKMGEVPDGPLKGRAWGEPAPKKEEWTAALHDYLAKAGVVEYAVVTQGCVLRHENGGERYLRNFSGDYGFSWGLLKGVSSVRRSPLTARAVANTKV